MSKGPPAQSERPNNKRKERERTDRDEEERIEITLSDDNIEVIRHIILLYLM